MPNKHITFLLLLQVFSIGLFAQEPILRFTKDSIMVGEPTQVVFYYKHKSNQEVFFPDSNFNFFPFEYVSRTYYPTTTSNGISTDSAIYTLALFEIEGSHALSLPVSILSGKDTVRIYSPKDSIAIKPLVTQISDTLKLKSNTTPLSLDKNTNFLILLIGLLVLILIAVTSYLLFGKSIRRTISHYYERLAHKRFLSTYDAIVESISSPRKMEEAISVWKRYIERLEGKPITTYTSAEIAFHLQREGIKKHLQNIDVAIYAGRSAEATAGDFLELRKLAIELYNLKQAVK